MGGAELLRDVIEREVLAEHAGMSGASLERVRLADGRVLVTQGYEDVRRFWDAATGARLPGEAKPGAQQRSAFALSADGERAAAVERDLDALAGIIHT